MTSLMSPVFPPWQVPLPSGEVWLQFPVVAVIVLCIALISLAVFGFTRWVWSEYKKERQLDLNWRAEQNKLREDAIAAQNNIWRDAITSRDARYEQYDKERQTTLSQVAVSMASLARQLEDHDAQAKNILSITERIDDNTRPDNRSRRKSI
jgi:hypothetical protein